MMSGVLHIVATPIGNLDDITLRALSILKSVDVIACEDTRHSQKLLRHFQINKKLISLHEHNEETICDVLLEKMQTGDDVALISDAGTPLISDPGFRLVHQAQKLGLSVSPVPGACAAIAALSVAGLPSHQFHFVGFLPAKHAARVTALEVLKRQRATLIFYEAPHRLQDSVEDMLAVFGEGTQACLARELTKQFETVVSGDLTSVYDKIKSDSNQARSEIVFLVSLAHDELDEKLAEALRIFKFLEKELPTSRAVQLAAKITGAKKNQLYKLVVE